MAMIVTLARQIREALPELALRADVKKPKWVRAFVFGGSLKYEALP
ncbi:hypothetical protein [Sulfuricystis thermophila]|nr:hypothetical protein [Sulfuricystis thermophila]